MYEHRPASELIFVTPSQHAKLHADACSKGGKKAGPKNIKIMRAKLTHEILSKGGQKGVKNQPREAKVRGGKNGGKKAGKMTKGKSWWNNGKSGTLAFECPGEDWVRGRLKKGH